MQSCASSACSNHGRRAASGHQAAANPRGEKHFPYSGEEPYGEDTDTQEVAHRLIEFNERWLGRPLCADSLLYFHAED